MTSVFSQDNTPNRLLQRLSLTDWATIAPHLVKLHLALRQQFETAGQPVEFVFFVEEGLGSIVARMNGGHQNEVGLIGCEGMTGSAIALGDAQSAFDCFVQMNGTALRLPSSVFRELLDTCSSLRQTVLAYNRTLSIQTASTALSNSQSQVDQRLARWLLMVHDRVVGDALSITHEYLSMMLGTRRPGVTSAMHILEGRHFIASTRGRVEVLDRAGLIEFCTGAYGKPELEYERLLGAPFSKLSLPLASSAPSPHSTFSQILTTGSEGPSDV